MVTVGLLLVGFGYDFWLPGVLRMMHEETQSSGMILHYLFETSAHEEAGLGK